MIITWFKIVTFHRRKVPLNFNIIWGDKCRMCPNLQPSAITFIALILWKESRICAIKIIHQRTLIDVAQRRVKRNLGESCVLFILQCHCHFKGQLTLEYEFELHKSSCTLILFNKYMYCYYMIQGWFHVQTWNWGYRWLTKGFEHLRILLSMVGPGTNPPCTLKEHCISQMRVLVT